MGHDAGHSSRRPRSHFIGCPWQQAGFTKWKTLCPRHGLHAADRRRAEPYRCNPVSGITLARASRNGGGRIKNAFGRCFKVCSRSIPTRPGFRHVRIGAGDWTLINQATQSAFRPKGAGVGTCWRWRRSSKNYCVSGFQPTNRYLSHIQAKSGFLRVPPPVQKKL